MMVFHAFHHVLLWPVGDWNISLLEIIFVELEPFFCRSPHQVMHKRPNSGSSLCHANWHGDGAWLEWLATARPEGAETHCSSADDWFCVISTCCAVLFFISQNGLPGKAWHPGQKGWICRAICTPAQRLNIHIVREKMDFTWAWWTWSCSQTTMEPKFFVFISMIAALVFPTWSHWTKSWTACARADVRWRRDLSRICPPIRHG